MAVPDSSKCVMPVNGGGLLSLSRYATQFFTVSTSKAIFKVCLHIELTDNHVKKTPGIAFYIFWGKKLFGSFHESLLHPAAPAVIVVSLFNEPFV